MKKRLLAMLLVLMMVVSLLPTGALAAGDGDTVDRLRLMNKEAWELAAIEKAATQLMMFCGLILRLHVSLVWNIYQLGSGPRRNS